MCIRDSPKEKQMRYSGNTLLRLVTVAFALVLTGAINASAATSPTQPAVQETVKKMKGVVVKRDPDSFTMSETTGGPQTTVILTADTEVKSHKRGAFRGSKEYLSLIHISEPTRLLSI